MLSKILGYWKRPDLLSFDQTVTREQLIQSGRIIVIDDEFPLLITELRREGFAVDYDQVGADLRNLENQLYDIAIVDYHGVGQNLGSGQGLDLLKHIRRVSPRTRIVAYTSRSLTAAESEFFRLSHAVLPKDLGLVDSLALIEAELKRAFSKEYLFEALLAKLNVSDEHERKRIYKALIKSLSRGNKVQFTDVIAKMVGTAAEQAVGIIIARLFAIK